MLQSELLKIQSVWSWLPQQGLQDGLPFVLIMVGIVVLSRRLPSRGVLGDSHASSIGRPSAPLRTTGITFVLGLIAILAFSQLYKFAFAVIAERHLRLRCRWW